jgi:hypothetical protein
MLKNATKCNKTLNKWCKNKHGASKIMDTFETYQSAAYAAVNRGGRRHGPRRRAVDPRQEEEEDFFCLPQSGTWALWFLGQANGPRPGELFFFSFLFFYLSIFYFGVPNLNFDSILQNLNLGSSSNFSQNNNYSVVL